MVSERKKLGFEKFLSLYFSNIFKYIGVNLIFAVPLCVAFGLCFLICRFILPQGATLILPLGIVIAAPFYSGVVSVSRDIYYDRLAFGIFREYINGVKENFKAFIVHGITGYLVFVGCYYGIVIYKYLTSVSGIFYVMLFISVLIALFFLFMLYALPIMSVSFDLRLKDVYKNSALMTFGEIKANFFATIGVLAYLAVVTFPLFFFFNLTSVWGELVSTIVISSYLGLIMILLVPSGVSAIITACLYPDMKRVITGEAKANLEAIEKEKQIQNPAVSDDNDREYKDVNIDNIKNSKDEYVFYKGKMIKRSVILKELEESERK